MKNNSNNRRDFFDDYSAEGEENSLPAEDSFSRPSRAWWERRDDIGVDDISDDELAALLGSESLADLGLENFNADDLDLSDFGSWGLDSEASAPEGSAAGEYAPYAEEPAAQEPVPSSQAPVFEDEPIYEEDFPASETMLYEEDPAVPAYAPYEGEPTVPEYEEPAPVIRPASRRAAPSREKAPAGQGRNSGGRAKAPERAEAASGRREKAPLRGEKAPAGREKPPVKKKAAPAKEDAPKKTAARETDNWAPPRGRKQKTFGRKLRRYIIILIILFAAIWAGLWYALGRYQNKQDTIAEAEALQLAKQEEEAAHALAVKRAPQLAFEEWYSTRTADDWAELWYADHPDAVDGKDRVAAYLSELFSGSDIKLFKGLDSTEEAPVFVIKNSQQDLGRVTMTGSDVNWSVDKAELCLRGDKSASIRVSLGTRVFCNGRELTEEYASEAKSTFSYEPLKDQLVNPVSWTTYEVSGMLLEPELTFEAPAGCSITETADGDRLLCLSDASAGEYQTKALNFVKSYLYYYLSGLNGTYGNLSNALLHLYPGSQAYTDLQDTYNGVVWNSAHSDIDTSKTEAGGVVIWADNCYSVDVTYDATGMVQGQLDEYAATMRVYFTKTDAGFAITHFETL